jgi:hypothetical protein
LQPPDPNSFKPLKPPGGAGSPRASRPCRSPFLEQQSSPLNTVAQFAEHKAQ